METLRFGRESPRWRESFLEKFGKGRISGGEDVLVGDHGRGGGGAVVQPGSHGKESLGVMDRRASCGGMNPNP